jgi:hypothetical protein
MVELIQKMIKAAAAKLDEAQRHHMAYVAARNKFIEDERMVKELNALKESYKHYIDYNDGMPDVHYVIRAGRKWVLYRWERGRCGETAAKAERDFLQALKEESKLTSVKSKAFDLENVGLELALVYQLQERLDDCEKILVLSWTARSQKTLTQTLQSAQPTDSRQYSYSGKSLTKQINSAAEHYSARGDFLERPSFTPHHFATRHRHL